MTFSAEALRSTTEYGSSMNRLRAIVTRHIDGADVLRIVLCMIIFTHGAYRSMRE